MIIFKGLSWELYCQSTFNLGAFQGVKLCGDRVVNTCSFPSNFPFICLSLPTLQVYIWVMVISAGGNPAPQGGGGGVAILLRVSCLTTGIRPQPYLDLGDKLQNDGNYLSLN